MNCACWAIAEDPGPAKPEGKWRFDALADTVRYECMACGHPIKETPVDRRWIENRGRFVPQNTSAPRARVSYTWNALLPHWVEWRAIVEEFLAAVDAMRVGGDIEPMFTSSSLLQTQQR